MTATADKPSVNGATQGNDGAATIAIDRIAEEHLRVPILGVSPLIVHRFSEKAKRMMLDNAMGRKTPKEPKDPDSEYEACFYRLDDGRFGFPADAFKQATVAARRCAERPGQVGRCRARLGMAVSARPGMSRLVPARLVSSWFGVAVAARRGSAAHGSASLGTARHGMARPA